MFFINAIKLISEEIIYRCKSISQKIFIEATNQQRTTIDI